MLKFIIFAFFITFYSTFSTLAAAVFTVSLFIGALLVHFFNYLHFVTRCTNAPVAALHKTKHQLCSKFKLMVATMFSSATSTKLKNSIVCLAD